MALQAILVDLVHAAAFQGFLSSCVTPNGCCKNGECLFPLYFTQVEATS